MLQRLTDPHLIFILPAIVVGLTVHEFAHAFASNQLGDPTPRLQGRLTLNPLAHMDPFGLISLVMFGFGWGRPVQINPNFYKNGSRDRIIVSLAGPVSNILIMLITSVVFRFVKLLPLKDMHYFFFYMISINAMLAIFNLLPIPPLDGSKIVLELWKNPRKYAVYHNLSQYSTIILIFMAYSGAFTFLMTPGINFLIEIAFMIVGN